MGRDAASDAMNEYSSANAMDDNKDDKVSAQELASATNISVREAELLIKQFDANGDGMLNDEEFDRLKGKILSEQKEKEKVRQIQLQQQERQKQQEKEFDDAKKNKNGAQNFKHKWKFGMNFDPKNESVVVYISDEVTDKNWGITLNKSDFNGPIRQEYRKLGATVS